MLTLNPNNMIRKFTHYLLLSVVWCCGVSCEDDEIASPPKPSFKADKTSAQVGEAITFTINQVNADAVSLLPYGLPGGKAGILVDVQDGSATVDFAYPEPGTFQAMVVANNHSGDGESIKNVQSEPITITITSSKRAITAFSFVDVETDTEIDEDAKTIEVTVPYGTDVSDLKASFTASGFSTVSVGSAEQTSGTTVNDFSSPVVYRVTANDGTTTDYTVTVTVTPAETINTINSISATAVSTNSDEKPLWVFLDNTSRTIVVYDTLGTPSSQFDSIRVGYELDGEFALLKNDGKKMEQDEVVDLTAMREFDVYSQDSTSAGGIQTYQVFAAAAPKLALSFPTLNPDPAEDAEPVNFDFQINALEGTDVTGINTVATTTNPAGVTVTGMKVDGAPFVTGDLVDYSEPVEFELTVNDSNLGVTYTIFYTVSVTVVP